MDECVKLTGDTATRGSAEKAPKAYQEIPPAVRLGSFTGFAEVASSLCDVLPLSSSHFVLNQPAAGLLLILPHSLLSGMQQVRQSLFL